MLTEDAKQSYALRSKSLKQLGFSSYKSYLGSAIWQDIRRRVLLPGMRCRACGNSATQIHHNRYSLADLNGRCIDQLIPVCGHCHGTAEFSKAGNKLSPREATNKLDNLRGENQKKWRKQDARDAWQHFFGTVEEVRVYLGMSDDLEARRLTEKLDEVLAGLPAKRQPKQRKTKHGTEG